MTYLPLLLLALFLQASRVTATSIVPHIHSNNCACKPGMPLGTGLPGSPNMTIPAFPGTPLNTSLPVPPSNTIPVPPRLTPPPNIPIPGLPDALTTLVTSIMGSMTVSFKPFGSTAAVSAPSAAPGTATITIKPGDTLESITKANNVGICDLVKANEIVDPDMVLSGETLVVPNEKGDPGDMSCLVHEY
ncbi:LysM domain containing protein [Pyrenophora tritici-repentis]|uniref:LysM domain-containing protein n=2 Tax=Pyrenophora tritici-repentis TaxID=45151 RepID=B2VX23_PYRTR|nr:uncharacterized protein PTRG_00260 [Pyrenophora tritici-repentis Pt-1C-BFP]EDU39698.1 predicted protein [Pyrenophora tritici-repentis Pt-1C-BFP]KAI1675482.1 LysM domain containing protein [Pyrenophora tritici-repentis]PZC99302.1 LysM domain containing protein [Pyrenophora tritici-repentis]PZD34924.1 LysM domain containing protein [Pyrenophora tritici-repentis]